MSLWRKVRGEVAGAWRSVNYDLGRKPAEPGAGGPDVTSTGMSTFPGSLADPPIPRPETGARPPRRFVAVTAFCMLALLGASGSYFAATSVFADEPPKAPPAGQVAAPAPPEFAEQDSAGLGAGPAGGRRPRTTPPVAPPAGGAAAPAAAPAGTAAPSSVIRPRHSRPAPAAGTPGPECHCTPPAPTPTAPPVTATPSASASPSPSETSASPSADPGASSDPDPSATPGESAEPSPGSDRRHRRRHHD